MQTLFWPSLIIGFLIQRSSARLLDDNCKTSTGGRITNGNDAELEAAAWMAGVSNETHFLCGGTLIHKRFVLTAAHCIKDQGKLFVRLGAYNLSLHVVEYSISNAVFHREYSYETGQNDIGLLQLPLDIVFTGQIYPICIDLSPTAKREVENANTFDAYGWGETRTARLSQILQRVTLDHYDRSRCNRIARSPLTLNQICAGSLNRDTCRGDSGGPLIRKVNYNGTRHLTQVGMVSYGLRSCSGLGVYTDVTSYADWIEEKIESLFPEYSSPTPIVNTVSIRPPLETDDFGAENFGGARLLFEPCGTSLSTRIRNGENAEPETAAWMARIHYESHFICGGTVIHKRFVLTAAQCLIDRQEGNLFVKLGEYDIRLPAQEYSVRKKIIHNGFDLRKMNDDIGLLQLSRDIEFSWHLFPICIILNPEVRSKVESAYTFDAYGWGRTNTSRTSNLLQKVTLDRYDRNLCNTILLVYLRSSQICAGSNVGDPCDGDSGGPLTKKVIVNGIQRYTQFGITSKYHGIAVFTDVTSYVDWIMEQVREFQTMIFFP
ncbi:transmembrane protease serine 9-like isoform X2 [Drosophila kikkawai]|uniref:Transmembrane protease serine 9-like isoform X2 n=1 Tax=Drosophila kikkawai TaxID=30033 RepID=A0A6P4HZM5_DROKI|nr:transmembrane protease serine 9-like isoform X2 [Drosophila kikkawai]